MATRYWMTALVGQFVVTTLVTGVYAQAPAVATSHGIDAAIEAARQCVRVPAEAEVSHARAQLDAAVVDLERGLNSNPLAVRFKSYLRWDDMRAQLDAGNDARSVELRRVAIQYFSDFDALGTPPFMAVGKALRNYANVLYASKQKDLKQNYDAEAENIVRLLAAYQAAPSEAGAGELAGSLRFLARYGKPDDLLIAVRERYSKPNLFVRADESLIAYGTRRDLNEPTPINEVILGTRIRGIGRTVGRLDANLCPDSQRAALDLILRGTTTSRTVGSNRSARIYSTGATTISGLKRITIEEGGIFTTPSTADAQTKTRITGIGSTKGGIMGKIVTNVASKRVAESKGQATAIASHRAESRICQRLDAEAAQQLEVSNRDYRAKFRDPLKRSGTYPHALKFSSTDDHLNVVALEAAWTQLGAPDDPPSLSRDHDLVVLAHESAVNNAGNTMYSGRTLRDYEIRAEIERRRGSLPDDMKQDEDRDSWSISFVDDQPIHFRIADGGFNVLLKFREFRSGERELKRVNVSAVYKGEKAGTRLVFVRQGDLLVKRDAEKEGEKIPIGEVALRSVLRKKFSKLFKERIEGEGLELPGKYKSLGKLPLGDYSMEHGWAAVGWDMPNTKVASRN